MAQTRTQLLATQTKKVTKEQLSKQKMEELRKTIEEADPVLVNGIDIKHCMVCSADKVDEDFNCSAYSKAGQVRWMRLGYCPLGNTGPNPPHIKGEDEGKRRAGQQKQKKR